MKVAVTGATGFIGRHVLAELGRLPVEVVAVARNTEHLVCNQSNCRPFKLDIADPDDDCFDRLGKPDVLIHLAWSGLPNYRSLHHFEIELPRHYRFLKLMIERGLRSLLVTGTCFEYGMQSGQLSEQIMPRPENPYGYAKDALRKQLAFFQGTRPFNLTWARLFYLYGLGQSKNSLYSQLNEAVRRGAREFPLSGGEQLRDYLPVSEVARDIVRLAMTQQNLGIINVCSGTPTSVRRLVEKWAQENHWSIELKFGHYPYPDYEPMAFWGDATLIKDILEDRDR